MCFYNDLLACNLQTIFCIEEIWSIHIVDECTAQYTHTDSQIRKGEKSVKWATCGSEGFSALCVAAFVCFLRKKHQGLFLVLLLLLVSYLFLQEPYRV